MEFHWIGKNSLKAFAKPSPDLSEVAVSPSLELPRMPRFDVFEMGVLRVDQQPRGDRERSALGLGGQSAKAERTADPHRPAENLACELHNAGKLGGATAQDNSRPRLCGKGGIGKPVPDHLKNLLGALANDVGDRRARHQLRGVAFVVAG